MKSTLKAVLVLALFCGTALAEGDMGNGGLWAGDGVITSGPTAEDGDMGNGGKTCPQGQTCLAGEPDESFSILKFVRSFLGSNF